MCVCVCVSKKSSSLLDVLFLLLSRNGAKSGRRSDTKKSPPRSRKVVQTHYFIITSFEREKVSLSLVLFPNTHEYLNDDAKKKKRESAKKRACIFCSFSHNKNQSRRIFILLKSLFCLLLSSFLHTTERKKNKERQKMEKKRF